MPKVNELVQQSIKQLSDSLKQIKQSDEDDLGEVASMFEDLSSEADRVANRLYNADKALSEDGNGEESEEGNEETEEESEQQQ